MVRGKHEKKKVKLLNDIDWQTVLIGALFDLLVGVILEFFALLIQALFRT